ncbi:MAG: MerR family transcriptional regulator [Flavobacteriales bacterium]|nr:MerR family transcriptional regulator [Flavobacteriales bacterium]
MPYKEKTIGKLYWSIGEVAEQLNVNTSLIRYWEKEFGSLRPKRTGKGDRLYTQKDIDHLQTIQHLVKEKGFTLQGAKDQLKSGEGVEQELPQIPAMPELKERLERLRNMVLSLKQRAN